MHNPEVIYGKMLSS